jgi:hypothetical protein
MRYLLALLLLALGFFMGSYWKQLQSERGTEDNPSVLVNQSRPVDPPALADDAATNDALTAVESHTIRLFEAAAPSVCYITTTQLRRNYFSRNVTEIPVVRAPALFGTGTAT